MRALSAVHSYVLPLFAAVAVAACAPVDPGTGTGSGGSSGTASGGATGSTGGAGTGGAPGSGGASSSGGAPAASGGAGPAGSGGASSSGGAPGASGGAPPGSGGASAATGGRGSGGAGTGTGTGGASTGGGAGAGTTGSGGSSGGGGATVPGSGEFDGANCTVGTLAEASGLPTVTKLPDPFKKLDGTRIAAKADWRCRREELRKMAEKYAYGAKPPTPQTVSGTVSNTSISVMVTDNGKSSMFTATVTLPGTGTGPYPAIIVYGGGGFGSPLDSGVIKSESVALITYDPYAVGKEGTGRANKQGAFYSIYGSNSTTGLLMAWAWGVSRIVDVIAKSGGNILKADAVGVTGCSRFGKGAFAAGVFDQRIALTMPVESGSAGVPIWRGIPGEGAQSLSSAYGEQPWFGDAFTSFTAAPTKAPLDTHELVAMVAPRGLFIMENPHIANLGPKSGHAAALAGAEVYKALGVEGNITYYSDVQSGDHCSLRPEWATPLRNNIQNFLKRTGNTPGVIKASSKATAKLSDWSDWTTPALN